MATGLLPLDPSRRRLLRTGTVGLVGLAAAGCDLFATNPATEGAGTEGGTGRNAEGAGGGGADGMEVPSLAAQVRAGTLPPLRKRLPAQPLVVQPAGGVGKYGGTLRNASIGTAGSAYIWCLAAYENLVRWTEKYTGAAGTKELTPNVATRFEVNADATEFTFHLRSGMRWSDGKPFTVDDVMFGLEDVLLNSELFPDPPTILTVEEGTARVERVGDDSFRVTFPGPAGLFLQNLAAWDGEPFTHFPKHYLTQFHKKYNPNVGELVKQASVTNWVELFGAKCGPGQEFGENPDLPTLAGWYLVTPFGKGPQLVLKRNPYYWKVDPQGHQLPYVDEFVFDVVNDVQVMLLRALHGDMNIEVGPDTRITTPANKPVIARNRTQGDYRFVDAVESRMNVMMIQLNLTHKDPVLRRVFQNRDFRVGLSHAIDRRELIDAVLQHQGEPYQVAPVPSSAFYDQTFATQYLDLDVRQANALLDKVLPDRGSDGVRLLPGGRPIRFTFDVSLGLRPEWVDMLDLVKRYFRRVGVEISVRTMERSLYVTRIAANRHDATVWHGDGGIDVLLSVGNYFPDSAGTRYAPLWGAWYESHGELGEKPPAPMRRQMELYDRVKSTGDVSEQVRLMTELLAIGREQFYVIGTVRETAKYFIANNAIHNLPKTMLQDWVYPTPGPTRTEQYYLAG